MNAILKPILERVEQWPPEAQEALARAALEIEQKYKTTADERQRPTLLDVMRACPFPDIEFERERVWPPVRDVTL